MAQMASRTPHQGLDLGLDTRHPAKRSSRSVASIICQRLKNLTSQYPFRLSRLRIHPFRLRVYKTSISICLTVHEQSYAVQMEVCYTSSTSNNSATVDFSAGKSTLLQILAGRRLITSQAADVRIKGKDVFRDSPPGVTFLGTEWCALGQLGSGSDEPCVDQGHESRRAR